MESQNELKARIIWSFLGQYAPAYTRAIVQEMGAVAALEFTHGVLSGKITAVDGVIKKTVKKLEQLLMSVDADQELQKSEQLGIEILTPNSSRWPTCLQDLGTDQPVLLYVCGNSNLKELSKRSVSMVGARNATLYGKEIAYEFSQTLSERGYTICSGGAIGIDTAIHLGAMDSANVAFLASGVDVLTPKSSIKMLNKMLESEGTVISEYPIGTHVTGFRFLERNRLIAAFSMTTVIIESALRSGSLSTLNHAQNLNRPVGAVPGSIFWTTSAGCNNAIRTLNVTLITSVDDIIELAMPIGSTTKSADGNTDDESLSGPMRDIMHMFKSTNVITLNSVQKMLILSIEDCLKYLTILHMKGYLIPMDKPYHYKRGQRFGE